jgi:hypothetical protein
MAHRARRGWWCSGGGEVVGVLKLAVLVGLTLMVDLNGSAEALAEADKSYWPPGIDYSRSVLASPRFSRLFGAMVLAIGAIFVGQAVIQL